MQTVMISPFSVFYLYDIRVPVLGTAAFAYKFKTVIVLTARTVKNINAADITA